MNDAEQTKYTCEEASPFSHKFYIPCGKPAKYLIKNKDPRPYWMCEFCADHNIRNRGAVIISTLENAEKQ